MEDQKEIESLNNAYKQMDLEIASFYKTPMNESFYQKPCCNYCAAFLHSEVFKCKECGAHWCSRECHELDLIKTHDDSCKQRQQLLQGNWTATEKRTYLNHYKSLLPPSPTIGHIHLKNDKVVVDPTKSEFVTGDLNSPDFMATVQANILKSYPAALQVQFIGPGIHGHSEHGHHHFYYQPYNRRSYFFPRMGWLPYQDSFWALAILYGLAESRNV